MTPNKTKALAPTFAEIAGPDFDVPFREHDWEEPEPSPFTPTYKCAKSVVFYPACALLEIPLEIQVSEKHFSIVHEENRAFYNSEILIDNELPCTQRAALEKLVELVKGK